MTDYLLTAILLVLLLIAELLRRQNGIATGHGWRTWRSKVSWLIEDVADWFGRRFR